MPTFIIIDEFEKIVRTPELSGEEMTAWAEGYIDILKVEDEFPLVLTPTPKGPEFLQIEELDQCSE